MAWSQVNDSEGNPYYVNSATGKSTYDPAAFQAQQAITPENLNAAYKQMYGTEAPKDWAQGIQAQYGIDKDITNVMRDMATSSATSNLPFYNKPGDTAGFTSGAQYYASQGYVPGSSSYSGVPTSFLDPKTGKVVASYGTIDTGDKSGRSVQSGNWTWNQAASTPEGYVTNLAAEKTPDHSLQDFLKTSALLAAAVATGGALAPEIAGAAGALDAGAGALAGGDALGAAGALGAGGAGSLTAGITPEMVAAFEAGLPETMADIGGLAGTLTAEEATLLMEQGLLPESMQVPAEALAGTGLTASDALKYAKLLAPLAGSALGGAKAGQPGQGGQGSGTTTQVSATGPWNTFLTPGMTHQEIVAQKPIMQNPQLATIYGQLDPYLANQLARSGLGPSNLGGSQATSPQMVAGVPSANYYSYGTQPQGADLMSYGQNLIGGSPLMAAKGGYMGDSEFRKSALGGNPSALFKQAQQLLNPSYDVGALSGFKDGGQEHVPEFITGATGHYVKGRGDGQSDDIPAMLADGEYVFDAETVAQLGNGSSDAGAAVLDKMREAIRKHKRSAPVDEIPPKSKSPLEYLAEANKGKRK